MTRYHVFLLGWVVLMVFVPFAFTQRGRGPDRSGGTGGFKMPKAEDIFNFMSGGASSFDVAKVQLRPGRGGDTPEQQREKMMTYLQTKGVTNGVMTKELYTEFFEGRMKEMETRMKEKGKEDGEKRFTTLSGGAASFDVAKVQIPAEMLRSESAETQREKMQEFLKQKGVTTGLMTKDLYIEFRENRFRELRDRREKGDTRTEAEKAKEDEALAKDRFKALDTNNDGAVTKEELEAGRKNNVSGSESLLRAFDTHDKNKNGKIELDEYTEYTKERASRDRRDRNGEKGKGEDGDAAAVEEDKRPTVYRFGKMPKGLPEWFEKLDVDLDAQVGLYEWKKDGRQVDEFLTMDSNGDGFLTVEEMLRYQKLPKKATETKNAVAVAAGPFAGFAPPPAGFNRDDKGGDKGKERFANVPWGNKMQGRGKGGNKGKGGPEGWQGKGKSGKGKSGKTEP